MPRSSHATTLLVAVILSFCFSTHGQAAVPIGLNYQGYLTDATGSPADANLVVTFSIYNVESDGVPLWTDSRPIAIINGLFSVELGDALNPFPDDLFDDPLWLGIQVEGDSEMMPRRALTSVAFSYRAEGAETAEFLGTHSATSLVNSICELYALTNNAGARPDLCGDCFTAADCDTGNECTTDSCSNPGSPNAVCSSIDVPDGTPCANGVCLAGVCTFTDACSPNPCDMAGQCQVNPGTCTNLGGGTVSCTYDVNVDDGTACDDGDPTTVDDQCIGGACVGTIPRSG